jgi:hypothetical protein
LVCFGFFNLFFFVFVFLSPLSRDFVFIR